MFEQTFKNIDDVLWKDAGCTSELDYTEQSSWLLFLKYLDALERDKATEALLEGRDYRYILEEPYRWERWAAPKTASGQLDHHHAMTGDDLHDFVNQQLFPYLHGFKLKVTSADNGEEIVHRTPQDIMDEIAELDAESAEVLAKVRELL